ncbi:MAG: methylmalonyl-CoA mutase family protein, partial [Chloroflexota bacterium]|nr:methylmalonyl-CoA mutase family protein [Chloroflexota bacterium]
MFKKDRLKAIGKKRKEWEQGPLKKSLERFGLKEAPYQFYTPLDIEGHDFLEKVGFPGEYPFTSGTYTTPVPETATRGGVTRAGTYQGYGTAEDTRDFYKSIPPHIRSGGPNFAFDLPTQCGYDSDHPMARGEVGKVGVAISSLRDFEIVYEAFVGNNDLDKIASNWTINAPANIILAMYIALAEKRGIPQNKLRGTPQNDILKEIVARGNYIFPLRPSMRMVRDTITYVARNMPLMNAISMTASHVREAGAGRSQGLAFCFSNAIAYLKLGLDAGLELDDFIHHITFGSFGGSNEFFKEIAMLRASRRIWAKIMRERFGAKNPKHWFLRSTAKGRVGAYDLTAQRPLNNITRSVIMGVASALAGCGVEYSFPYDEPLGLGHSLEAKQISVDAMRIMKYESRLEDVIDPLAGSYYVEHLTDEVEAEVWEVINKVDSMGGAVAAIENGYYQQEIARGAYEHQREIETGERVIVGVNKFTGEEELEVLTSRLVPHPYDPEKRAEAEVKQIASLAKLKRERDNASVALTLKRLEEAARDESVNLIPHLL